MARGVKKDVLGKESRSEGEKGDKRRSNLKAVIAARETFSVLAAREVDIKAYVREVRRIHRDAAAKKKKVSKAVQAVIRTIERRGGLNKEFLTTLISELSQKVAMSATLSVPVALEGNSDAGVNKDNGEESGDADTESSFFSNTRGSPLGGIIPEEIEQRNALVVENLGLVYFVIKKYFSYLAYRSGIPNDDIVGYGTEGLIRAAGAYDSSRAKFSTYAPLWIRQTIQRMVQDCEYTIRIPVHRADEFVKKRRESEYKEQQALVKGEEPTMVENGFSKFGMISLDDIGQVKEGRDRHEVIPSSSWSPEEQMMSVQKSEKEKKRISLLQKRLTSSDWYVLSRRWGVNSPDSEGASLEKIGIELGVTRERVRQIEVQALKRARKILKGK